MNKSKLLFTGGGSAGHVTPNLVLIQLLKNKGIAACYVGSTEGIERSLVGSSNIPYYAITTGKLRRYWSWKNFLTPFQLVVGIVQSYLLCRKLKPSVVFSKGGFVSLPVVIGSWLNNIPIVIHESDLTPGLANRLSFPFAKHICVTFSTTVKFFKNKHKLIVTGVPIRVELKHGDRYQGLKLCGFEEKTPVLLIMAGGLGSIDINNLVRRLRDPLTRTFQVIHLCGKGKLDESLLNTPNYKQFDFLEKEFPDVLASADLVVSRAGATSIYELIALKKPHILLPLSKHSSRGDQINNADYFAQQGISEVLYAEELSDSKFLQQVLKTYKNLDRIKSKLARLKQIDSAYRIINILESFIEPVN